MLQFVMDATIPLFDNVVLMHRGNHVKVRKEITDISIPVVGNCLFLWRFNQIRCMRRIIKKYNPSIICCFGTEQSVMLSISMIGLKGPKIVLADRTDPYSQSIIWSILIRWAFRKADRCVFQLERQGEWYGEKVMKKSVIIPNAFVKTGEYGQCHVERKKTIVSVGRFVREKNYELLIESFKIIHEIHPDYRLILYGDGPYRDKYNEMIAKFNLSGFVDMPGYVSDSMAVLQDAGVFVLSSLYEGIPNVLIEAMASGVPTVSTDCSPGGPAFLTDKGRRGLLVPVNDIKKMVDAISSIISNPELAENLSRRGRDIVSILDKDKIAKNWKDFFSNL